MSSPATANFLAAWRSKQCRPALLCKISLTSPSALTLYLSNTDLDTPDGQHWDACISRTDPMRYPGDLLATGPDFVNGAIYLDRRRIEGQSSAQDVSSLLSGYYWSGAAVTLWYWEQSLTSFSDAFQCFSGTVDGYEANLTEVHLYLVQATPWAKRLPVKVLNKIDYPKARETDYGTPIPVIYGDFSNPILRAPWPSLDVNNQHAAFDCGRQFSFVDGIVTDRGLGTDPLKVLFASHPVYGTGSFGTDGLTLVGIDSQNGLLARVDATSYSITNDANGFGVTLADEKMQAYAMVKPTDVRVTGPTSNLATDTRNTMDTDETTAASMDSTTHKDLELVLPDASSLGTIVSVEGVIGYSTSWITTGGTWNMRLFPLVPGGTSGATIVMGPSATANVPKTVRGAWDSGAWHGDWRFGQVDGAFGGGFGATSTIDFYSDFGSVVGGNSAKIYFVGLVVKYIPQQSLITAGIIGYGGSTRGFGRGRRGWGGPSLTPRFGLFQGGTGTPSIYELQTGISANLYGYADDGSGTFTGTLNSLISRTPDIMRHLVVTYGAASGSIFETGSPAFGSFVDARTSMKTFENADFLQRCHIGSIQNVTDVLRTLASDALAQVILDGVDGKFRIIPWRRAQSVDYDLPISLDETLGAATAVQTKCDSTTGLSQSVRITYGAAPSNNAFSFDAVVNPDTSDEGYLPGLIGDQLIKFTSSNNVLKFDENAGTLTATIAAGTYLGIDAAQAWQTAIRAATSDTKWWCGWGFAVKSGFNDTLAFDVGGATLRPTVPAFSYGPEAACAAAQKAMNAIQGTAVFTITYSRSTGKVQVSAGGVNFTIHNESTESNSMWSNLGFAGGAIGPVTSTTAANVRMQEFFHASYSTTTGHLLWTNAGTTCASVLGYAGTADATVGSAIADYRRGDRQTRGDSSRTLYGETREVAIKADTLYSPTMAADVRDRIFDFKNTPRVRVQFSTHRCPDLQRGRIIQFDPSLDQTMPFPRAGSDGSWVGKVFRVVEVVRYLGPQWHQDVVAYEIDPV